MTAITYACPDCHWHGSHSEDCPSRNEQPTPETQRAEQGSVDEGESSRAIDRARRSAERLADQHDAEQSEVEAGEWYFIKWYDVDLKAYPQEPKFAIEHEETLVAIALEQATAERIINDHRLAALVSQLEAAIQVAAERRALNERRPTSEWRVFLWPEAEAALNAIRKEREK